MRTLKRTLLYIGNRLHGVSFKWFDMCNLPVDCFDWKWIHKILFMIGTVGVITGSIFHAMSGDEYEASKRQNT